MLNAYINSDKKGVCVGPKLHGHGHGHGHGDTAIFEKLGHDTAGHGG